MQQQPPSLHGNLEQDRLLKKAEALKSYVENANLNLLRDASDFESRRANTDELSDTEDGRPKDPSIVAADLAANMSTLRKLKFEYLEKNAKDRYVKTVVSDIDDTPLVSAEDNKDAFANNAAKKEQIKAAKSTLAELYHDIRTLAPLVEKDYRRIKDSTTQAAQLAQQLIDARLALTRLRKTHPHPRYTVPLAEKKLNDQVVEMQELNDESESTARKVLSLQEQLKQGAQALERLRAERAEVEKQLKVTRIDEDGKRLGSLYSWYSTSLNLHRSVNNLHKSHSVSENELRLTYSIDGGNVLHQITITLVFAPDTRQLTAVRTSGLAELDLDVENLVDAHIQANDVHGVVAAILSRARARALTPT